MDDGIVPCVLVMDSNNSVDRISCIVDAAGKQIHELQKHGMSRDMARLVVGLSNMDTYKKFTESISYASSQSGNRNKIVPISKIYLLGEFEYVGDSASSKIGHIEIQYIDPATVEYDVFGNVSRYVLSTIITSPVTVCAYNAKGEIVTVWKLHIGEHDGHPILLGLYLSTTHNIAKYIESMDDSKIPYNMEPFTGFTDDLEMRRLSKDTEIKNIALSLLDDFSRCCIHLYISDTSKCKDTSYIRAASHKTVDIRIGS